MFPNTCRCVAKCCAYLEAWVLHRIPSLFSLNLVLNSAQSALRKLSRSLDIYSVETRICEKVLRVRALC